MDGMVWMVWNGYRWYGMDFLLKKIYKKVLIFRPIVPQDRSTRPGTNITGFFLFHHDVTSRPQSTLPFWFQTVVREELSTGLPPVLFPSLRISLFPFNKFLIKF